MRRVACAVLALAAIAATGTTMSGATFIASKSNPGNTFTAAATFCIGSTQTLSASQDSYVDQAFATTNYGAATSLSVESSLLNLLVVGPRRTLVEFSLPPLANCSVTAATLNLYATAAAGSRTIQVFQLNGSWTEAGVTWNSQPATTGSAVTGTSGTGTRSWTVTSEVQAMYSGTSYGFLVRDSNESSITARTQTYQSREGTPDTQDPQLVITFG